MSSSSRRQQPSPTLHSNSNSPVSVETHTVPKGSPPELRLMLNTQTGLPRAAGGAASGPSNQGTTASVTDAEGGAHATFAAVSAAFDVSTARREKSSGGVAAAFPLLTRATVWAWISTSDTCPAASASDTVQNSAVPFARAKDIEIDERPVAVGAAFRAVAIAWRPVRKLLTDTEEPVFAGVLATFGEQATPVSIASTTHVDMYILHRLAPIGNDDI